MSQFNQDKFDAQWKYLLQIRRMKTNGLKNHYRQCFSGTKWRVSSVPSWCSRKKLEDNLYLLFCMRGYHYPLLHPLTVAFVKYAEARISASLASTPSSTKLAPQQLRKAITKKDIAAMPINKVDRMLASFNIYVEGDETTRRRVLHEWFTMGTDTLSGGDKKLRTRLRRTRTSRFNNQFSLVDLVLKHPELGWGDFRDKFEACMPTVTNGSWKQARCKLRRAGYNIPKLRSGPTQPVVVTKNGKETIPEDVDTFGRR